MQEWFFHGTKRFIIYIEFKSRQFFMPLFLYTKNVVVPRCCKHCYFWCKGNANFLEKGKVACYVSQAECTNNYNKCFENTHNKYGKYSAKFLEQTLYIASTHLKFLGKYLTDHCYVTCTVLIVYALKHRAVVNYNFQFLNYWNFTLGVPINKLQ